MRIRARRPNDPALAARLSRHPMVDLEDGLPGGDLTFWQGDWRRTVVSGRPTEVRGLVELMDNNPMVCADEVSVPSPAGTLALIALGPLARGNLIVEAPVLRTNAPGDAGIAGEELATEGWPGGLLFEYEERDLAGVLSAHAIVEIPTPEVWSEIDELYEEAYGRSLYVVRDEESAWHVDLVRDRPFAAYRLAYTPGEVRSLLTIQAMADRDGKCGSAQIVHALNLMAGFEESLGID